MGSPHSRRETPEGYPYTQHSSALRGSRSAKSPKQFPRVLVDKSGITLWISGDNSTTTVDKLGITRHCAEYTHTFFVQKHKHIHISTKHSYMLRLISRVRFVTLGEHTSFGRANARRQHTNPYSTVRNRAIYHYEQMCEKYAIIHLTSVS